jgi:hypothetical protein
MPTLAIFLAPKPAKTTVGVAVAEVLLPVVGGIVALPTKVKFAHVIRVLFAKWKVIDRLPKKEPRPGRVDEKRSVYVCTREPFVTFPYFPDRSPTWQVCGSLGSHATT